jgi:hypothetical protein
MVCVATCHSAEVPGPAGSHNDLTSARRSRTRAICRNLRPASIPANIMELCLPDAADVKARELSLRSLPLEGDLNPLPMAYQKKVAALAPIMQAHDRLDVYVIKVIRLPQATAALHGRSVLLFTAPAIELLNPEELEAITAHEIAHEYFWDEYFNARQRGDTASLQRIELLCDAVAVRTLQQTGRTSRPLGTAVAKLARFNTNRLGIGLNESEYPDLSVRLELIRSYDRSLRAR